MVEPPPRRSRRPFIVLAVILTLIALGCFLYWWINRDFATTDDAEIDGNVYTVAPQIAGRVARVAVDDNQHVTAGQVLVVLDGSDEKTALAKAEADLGQAKAQYLVAVAEADEATAQVAQHDAELRQAQQDYDRYRSVNQHAVTQQQVDAATATILSAAAKSKAAIAASNAAQASIVAALATVKAEQVAVQNAKLQLSYTVITAPAAGHVSMKTVQPGNVVAAGTAMMAVVGDDVWVTANYKETQLPGIRIGEPATIHIDAVPGITFHARVNSIQYGTGSVFSLLPAENATGNYVKIVQRVPVKLVFDDPRISRYLLAPGMSVEPSIDIRP